MKSRKKSVSKPEAVVTPQAEAPGICREELTPRDLIDYELRLKEALSRFIKFKAYSLYFPTGKISHLPKWLADEKKLLLPLVHNEKLLGVFSASGVSIKQGQLTLLSEICALCLDNLALFKAGLLEQASGLYTREYLLDHVAAAVTGVQNTLAPGKSGTDIAAAGQLMPEGGLPELGNLRTGSFGHNFALMAVNFSPLTKVSREYGYAFGDQFMLALARAFREVLPDQALAARISDNSFAVYLPGRTPADCLRLGREVCKAMEAVELSDPLTHTRVSLPVAAGFACYPQDLELARLRSGAALSAHEQAMQI